MKTVLVISSFVASSRVGATASAFCLRRLGVDAVILPTTLMGRHPGWGSPGGGATGLQILKDMWQAISAQDIVFDGVLCGYMGDIAHTEFAAQIIKHVKVRNPDAHILVDPIMGDHGTLYIPQSRAQAIKDTLIPLADTITPNLWELSYLLGLKSIDLDALIIGAKEIAPRTLITSAPNGNELGAILIDQTGVFQLSHKKYETVPHGGGDALAATFLAHMLLGRSPGNTLARNAMARNAMEKAVAAIFTIMSTANQLDAGELPLIREQDALLNAKPLKSWTLDL